MTTVDDLLTLAERYAQGGPEVEWRASVSRAYDAAFHEARTFLRQLGFHVPRGDMAHAYLSLRLSNCGHPNVEAAGRRLNSLRGDRNRANYDIDKPMRKSEAALAVAAARIAVETLSNASASSDTGQLVEEIRQYETNVLKTPTWHG